MKHLLLIAGLLLCLTAHAQQFQTLTAPNKIGMNTGEAKHFRTYKSQQALNKDLRRRISDTIQAINEKEVNLANKAIKSRYSEDDVEAFKDRNMLLLREDEDLEQQASDLLDTIVARGNRSERFALTGLAGVSNLSELKNITGNFSGALTVRLTNYKRAGKAKDWIDPIYAYMAFNSRVAGTEDTGNLARTFLFPQLNRAALIVGTYRSFTKGQWGIEPVVDFAINNYKKTDSVGGRDTSYRFQSYSFTTGCRFSATFPTRIGNDSTLSSGIQVFLYYNLINVGSKYFTELSNPADHAYNNDYNQVMGELHMPATYHTIGAQLTLQLPKLIVFSDMKYVLNNTNGVKNTDLWGFNVIFGTLVALDVLKF